MRRMVLAALCLAMIALPASSALAEDDAVVIENMGRTTAYETAPESAAALSYSIAEIMVALGLEDKIVAVAPSMYILDQVSEEYREAVGSFPLLKGNYGVPSLETVLDTNAEFVFGDSYSFYASSVGTPEDFEAAGVKVYATEGTCYKDATFENIYNDILNIGRIFRVEERAQELVAQLRERAAVLEEKVGGLEPVSVFYFDSDTGGGVEMATIGNTGLQSLMVRMAGGENIFGDVDGQFITVSWEDVVDRDPTYIVVCDYYGEGYAEEKIEGMKTNPATMEMDAVKNDRFIVVPGLAMFPSLECMDAVELMADGLHP
ncbi:MAG: ABC transporter substrate-binding protein [Clostridia bacterium]|nr:ABC transporter substrate-binding protein [Clostridia bacterium]